jgi:hypothetical protein
MIYKTQNRKLTIEKHELHKNPGWRKKYVVFFYVRSPVSANNKIKYHNSRYHRNIVENWAKHQLTNSNKMYTLKHKIEN